MKELLICALVTISFLACKSSKGGQIERDPACALVPDVGPCKMAITRYYYDAEENKCKAFTYGGCKGVVPFKSLELCKKKCGCEE